MKARNIVSSLVLILLGAVFCVASTRLGLGNVTAPGPGFVPFLAGALLILFSLGTIFETRPEAEAAPGPLFGGKRRKVVLSVLGSLFIYALILDLVGFILATFFILIFLFKVSEKQSWKVALGTSALTMVFTYFLFDYFLQITFPQGFLGF